MATPPQVWDPHAASHVRALLAVVGERVAALVDESRRPDDVPDERRGHVFPLDLVIRDARDLAGVDSRLVISDADLSDDMTRWAMLCGLSDSELGTLIVAAAVHVDPRFEAFFIVLNNEVDTRGPSVATTAPFWTRTVVAVAVGCRASPAFMTPAWPMASVTSNHLAISASSGGVLFSSS